MNNSSVPITVIKPKKGWAPVDLVEIWGHNECQTELFSPRLIVLRLASLAGLLKLSIVVFVLGVLMR